MKKCFLLLVVGFLFIAAGCADDGLDRGDGWIQFSSAYLSDTFHIGNASGGISWNADTSRWYGFFFDDAGDDYIYVSLESLSAGTRTDSGFTIQYRYGDASYWSIGTTGNTVTISENTGSRIRGVYSVTLKDSDTGDTLAATGVFDSAYNQ